jgi:Holin of 3TMs, for gene-transfer release
MDFSSLISVLKPLSGVLGGVLAGPVGATAAPLIVGTLASAFGLGDDATPEQVAREIETNPAAPAIIAEAEQKIGKTVQEIEAAVLETVNGTMREEIKSEHWMTRSWRPLWGIASCVIWFLHGLVMAYQMARGDFTLIAQIPNLSVYYGAALAVVGVYALGRTKEKMASIDNPLMTAVSGAIKKVVR